MTLRDKYVETLEAENSMLRERVASLEALLGGDVEVPLVLDLTSQQSRLLGFMLKRDLVTKEAALQLLYGHRPDDEVADAKIIDVFVCHIRRKLKPFGIAVETRWGQGYYLPPESKLRLRAMLPSENAA